MKKLFTLFFIALLPIVANADQAYDAYIGGIFYTFNSSENTATVTYMSYEEDIAGRPGDDDYSETHWYMSNYVGNVVIPRNVTYNSMEYTVKYIGAHAFEGSGVSSVDIPNNVKYIYECAFKNCHSLVSASLSKSVKYISDNAFDGCSRLMSVNLPDNVKDIGKFAFQGCKKLTSINIPDRVTNIAEGAFRECRSLTSVTLGNGLTSIGSDAFNCCIALTSITIPGGVTSISEGAFEGCSSLTTVTCQNCTPPSVSLSSFPNRSGLTLYVPEGSKAAYMAADYWKGFKAIVEIPNIRFSDAKVKALCVANWDTNADGELSELEAAAVTDLGTVFTANTAITSFDELKYFTGLTSIGEYTFIGCSSLTSVTIPISMRSIGDYAFMNCSSLTSLTCLAANPPAISNQVFPSNLKTVYVPLRSAAAYRAADYWKDFSIVSVNILEISDETMALNIADEEGRTDVKFTHQFTGEWESLYLPFAINYRAIKADFDLAEIDGIIQNDDNNDGIADIIVLSIMGFKEGATTPNTPYLIRAKRKGVQTISFDNITVYPTEEKTFDCSSFSTRYEFTGSYNTLNASALANHYIVQNGELVKGASSLAPCRWYMTATARRGTLNLPNKIRIMSVEDVITGVENLSDSPLKGENIIYNLAGQRVDKLQKGINIKDGKKIIKN